MTKKLLKNKKIGLLIISVLIMTLLATPVVFGGIAANIMYTNTTDITSLSDGLNNQKESYLNKFVHKDAQLRHLNLKSYKLNITSQKLEDGTLTVFFNVDQTTTLNYSLPENVPMLKGRLAFRNSNAQKLSKAKLQALDRDNNEVKKDLQSYIKEPAESFNSLKLVGKVENGKLKEDSVSIYSADPLGRYKPYKLDTIPTEAVAEQQAFSAAKATAESDLTPLSTTSVYNRFTARDYANTYTSNTSYKCWRLTVYQDADYYNSSYDYYPCVDCANYGSQALHAGGIPTDSTWYPDSSTWKLTLNLFQYMANQGYITPVALSYCVAGYPFALLADEHTMMMVYNDGYSYRYSAHTNDRLNYVWTPSSSATYYKVLY